jgi:hypothetical protein
LEISLGNRGDVSFLGMALLFICIVELSMKSWCKMIHKGVARGDWSQEWKDFYQTIITRDKQNFWVTYGLQSKNGALLCTFVFHLCINAIKFLTFLCGVTVNLLNGIVMIFFIILISNKKVGRKFLIHFLVVVDVILLARYGYILFEPRFHFKSEHPELYSWLEMAGLDSDDKTMTDRQQTIIMWVLHNLIIIAMVMKNF